MKKLDKLLRHAEQIAKAKKSELNNYDFSRLTTAELKELAFGNPDEERFSELFGKAAKPAGG